MTTYTIPILSILLLLLCAATSPACADNGEVAYAHPLTNIAIDGDLGDWPEDVESYSIENGDVETGDFQARFRVGYEPDQRALLLAVEVRDESHLAGEPDLDWYLQDSHLLYIDPTHSPRGSGPWLFSVTGDHRRPMASTGSWDPLVAEASWDETDVAVRREGSVTTYEWQVGLGETISPGRSLGLDHLISDNDEGEPDNAFVMWGRYGAKSRRTARCGDIVLLDPDTELGVLRGSMAWPEGVDGPELEYYRVRITALNRPELWVQPRCDQNGNYEVTLPAGNYRIESPFLLYGDGFTHRLKDDVYVTATVKPGETTQAPPLLLAVAQMPELFGAPGMLFDFEPEDIRRVDEFVRAYMHYYDVPGLSLALLDDGQLVYHGVYGVKNALTQEPVEPSTLFEACSMTKTVFAFVVLRLAEEGVLDLDRPLWDYLPLEELAHEARARAITARHVLSHRSGLPNWRSYNDDGNLDVAFEPGSDFRYSGEAFEYLGRVVAGLTSKSLEQLLLEHVQRPLGFAERTHFSANDELARKAAHGHELGRPFRADLPEEIGVAHSMHTEAATFARFMLGLMHRRGLSARSYESILQPVGSASDDFVIPGLEHWTVSYGLGFELLDTPFGRAYGHGGSNGDFECRFEIYDEHDSGFVVFANSDTGEPFYRALRHFLVAGGTSPPR